jgi:hypothetical protein
MTYCPIEAYFRGWNSQFRSRYLPEWPSAYLCVDSEYDKNGSDGLLFEIGHVLVRDGVVIDRKNYVLNWYATSFFSRSELDRRLEDISRRVQFDWRLTPEVVQREGIDPLKVLRFYARLFELWAQQNGIFVLQNGQAADERLFAQHFEWFLRRTFAFPDALYLDTGVLGKALQAWTRPDEFGHLRDIVLPMAHETPKQFFARVSGLRVKGLRWKLELLLEQFGVLQKIAFDTTTCHQAVVDAECLHWLMEEFREPYRRAAAATALSVDTVAEIVEEELAAGVFKGYAPGSDPRDSVATTARQRSV